MQSDRGTGEATSHDADLGLTSARWQVLGAAVTAPVPLSIASIARSMGLTRQTVRTTAKDLEAAALVRLASNPHHQRAHLVVPAAAGARLCGGGRLPKTSAEMITRGLDGTYMTAAADILQVMLAQVLDAPASDEP